VLHPNSCQSLQFKLKQEEPQRGIALFVVIIILTLFLALAIQLNTQSLSQSKLTSSRRLNVMYKTAAETALTAVQTQLSNSFIPLNEAVSSSDNYDHSATYFSGLLRNPLNDDWENRYGVDYKTYGQASVPGLEDRTANSWLVTLNNGRLPIPVRVFIKNNPDDPAFAFAGVDVSISGQTVNLTENTDFDGRVLMTAVAYGVHNSEEPMAILTGTFGPDPNYDVQDFSKQAGNQGMNNNRGWN